MRKQDAKSLCATTSIICLLLAVAGCGGDGGSDKATAAQKKKAVAVTRVLYKVAKTYSYLNLSRGPCIGNPIPGLGGDWVADIAHDPRRPIDDKPGNQCPLAREGKAHHFVEVDPSGKLIRVR